MRRWIMINCIGCVMLLTMQLISSQKANAQQTASDFFKMTLSAMKYKDYDLTVYFATKSIALNPTFGSAYWDRAIAYDFKREYRKAINDYDSAISYYSNNSDLATLYKNKGMVYCDMKLYDSALYDFDKSLDLNPEYGLAMWNKGIAYDGKGMYDSAVNNYTRALKHFTSVSDICQLHLLRGLAYSKLNKTEKAKNEFSEILKLDTGYDYQTAYAKFILKNKDSARWVIRTFILRAKGNDDEYANAYFNAARLFSVMDNHEKSIGCLEMSFDNGYKNFRNIDTDRDFDKVRNDPKFIDLVKKYEEKDRIHNQNAHPDLKK